MGKKAKKRMRTETELSRVSLGRSDLGPALPHTGPELGSSENMSLRGFSIGEKEDNSFILIGVQAGRAICFSSIGQFDAKAASKHFNLSWHFHLSHINPHSRPPDNICSFICTVPH